MKFPFSDFFHRKKRQGRTVRPKKASAPDGILVGVVVLLSLFGILMVYNASVTIAIRDFSDKYYFAREQLKWLVMGGVACWFFARFDYRRWRQTALPLLLVTLVLLMAVFLPVIGIRALGASRWVNLGFFTLQPAELAKLAFIIYLAAWFSVKEKGRLGAFLLLILMVVGLIVLQPDLGTAAILFSIAIFLYFFSEAPIGHIASLVVIFLIGVFALSIVSPYRFSRVLTFINPEHDPLGSSYQIRQVLLALGSGGFSGVGLGQSRQKFAYLPEANTDSIFAVIGEELGFVGAAAVIALFFLLIWRGFRIARRTPDMFGRLLALGITSWIAIQTAVNLAAMVALIPLTGVPLPFISYGGSSLIIILTAVGILMNISRART